MTTFLFIKTNDITLFFLHIHKSNYVHRPIGYFKWSFIMLEYKAFISRKFLGKWILVISVYINLRHHGWHHGIETNDANQYFTFSLWLSLLFIYTCYAILVWCIFLNMYNRKFPKIFANVILGFMMFDGNTFLNFKVSYVNTFSCSFVSLIFALDI